MKRTIIFLLILSLLIIASFLIPKPSSKNQKTGTLSKKGVNEKTLDPLTIEAMRKRQYPGSDVVIERTLPQGLNYSQYLVSYLSDGLKIYALLTVPVGQKPKNGWPVIIFNHGYITPETYQTYPTVGQYASYFLVFSSSGYIVFKPDYRGNGESQGSPEGAYYSPSYAIDDLNGIASIKKFKDADPSRIGIWGHSMGGNITLRDLVVNTKDIKAAVIWGGVVGSYEDLMNNWIRKVSYQPSQKELALRNRSRESLTQKYGTPENNPSFWNSADPTFFVKDITAPVQIDVGSEDEEVPVAFSESLYKKLLDAGKTVEFYSYPGANHNISQGFNLAMQRSLSFFDKFLK